VLGVGDVADDRGHALQAGQGSVEVAAVASVDDDPPAALRECPRQREAETARRTRDHCDRIHVSTVRPRPAQANRAEGGTCLGLWT
jgi:hypothetical protein